MKIEKKVSERRPSALSKEEIVPEATVVQFADDNENKKTDLRSRQKDLKRMSFTKKKGSAEFDLKKVLDEATTKNPTKPRVQAGEQPAARFGLSGPRAQNKHKNHKSKSSGGNSQEVDITQSEHTEGEAYSITVSDRENTLQN